MRKKRNEWKLSSGTFIFIYCYFMTFYPYFDTIIPHIVHCFLFLLDQLLFNVYHLFLMVSLPPSNPMPPDICYVLHNRYSQFFRQMFGTFVISTRMLITRMLGNFTFPNNQAIICFV